MMDLPGTCFVVCERLDLLGVEGRFAEHALDLVWFVLLDLEAEVDFPAFVAGTFMLFMLVGAVYWGDSERIHLCAADVALL